MDKMPSPAAMRAHLRTLELLCNSFHSISLSIVAALAVLVSTVLQAHAAFVMTLQQVGPNVVGTGSGSLDTSSLTIASGGSTPIVIRPESGLVTLGIGGSDYEELSGFTGPSSFGSGALTFGSSGTGDLVGMDYQVGYIEAPTGYVSGSALSDSATWPSATFSSLGITTGTYTWIWGDGATADSFTLEIVPADVPEPSTWAMMAAGIGVMLAFRRRRRSWNASIVPGAVDGGGEVLPQMPPEAPISPL